MPLRRGCLSDSRLGQRSATRHQKASKCGIASHEVDFAWSRRSGNASAGKVSEVRRGNRKHQNAASRRTKSTLPGVAGAATLQQARSTN